MHTACCDTDEGGPSGQPGGKLVLCCIFKKAAQLRSLFVLRGSVVDDRPDLDVLLQGLFPDLSPVFINAGKVC